MTGGTGTSKLQRTVDGNTTGATTISVTCGTSYKTVTIIVYSATCEVDADKGSCSLSNVGHAWWKLSIEPTDVEVYLPGLGGAYPDGYEGTAGYYDHCQPQGPGQVIFGTQIDQCGGGGAPHPTTGSYWWCVPFDKYKNALGYVEFLNDYPGTYDVLVNNCVTQAIAVGKAANGNPLLGGFTGVDPCSLSKYLNFMAMSINPGPPPFCSCQQ